MKISKLYRCHKGMTLIEIMIVVVIIGIVFAYIFINAGQYTEKAKYSRAEEDLQLLASALSIAFVMDGGGWTPKAASITTNGSAEAWNELFNNNIANKINSKMSNNISQIKDAWGNPYDIIMTINGTEAICYIICRPDSESATYETARLNKYLPGSPKMARLVVFRD